MTEENKKDEETQKIHDEVGDETWEKGRPDETREIFESVSLSDDFPEFLGKENAAGTPITALVVTSLGVQGLLALTLFVSDALNLRPARPLSATRIKSA